MFQALPKGHADLAGYAAPPMMAIGDSIYNGTRSLSSGGGLEQLAVPAIVARALGIGENFRIPNYPRKVLFDLEEHVRQGLDLERLRAECIANAKLWLDAGGVWSSHKFFDNISIAGAEIADLWTNTSGEFKIKAHDKYLQLVNSSSLDFGAIGDLYYAINAAFLLNPSGDPDLDDLTPLEQVASRRPKRLIINIGSNDGLFRCGMDAKVSRDNRLRLEAIPKAVETLAGVLRDHCGDVEHIYFNSLLRPRALANLTPRSDEEMYNPPPKGGYFKLYIGRLGSPVGMSGSQMKELDEVVRNVNTENQAILSKELKEKCHFVDCYDWAGTLDRKHGTEKTPIRVKSHHGEYRLSNYPLSVMFGGFKQGGLFSLDNMHPTTVGYALLANHLCAAITAAETIPHTPYPIQSAYEADSLLQNLPSGWDTLMVAVNLLMSLRGIGLAITSRGTGALV